MEVESRSRAYALAIALLTLLLLVLAADSAGSQDASAVLDSVRLAYAEAGPFHETLVLELEMPDGSKGLRQQDYGVGSGGEAFFRIAADGRKGLRIVARDGRIVADWAHLPERYAESAYDGDAAAAFEALEAPQVQLWAPPAIVAAQGGDRDALLQALRFGVLQPVEPVAVRQIQGGKLFEVELAAANGTIHLAIAAESRRFASIRFTMGEGESQVRATGNFSFSPGEPTAELAWPDLEGRVSVPTLTALEASEYPIGEPAPAITVATLGGDPVDLGSLRGQVVMLDFWATWCVPCWSALEHTQELTRWAASSGLPVRVFAVDSLEKTTDLEAQREQAQRFLSDKGLELDVLIDHDNSAFAAFHNPGLPSMVLIDREGRLAEYHSGVLENMTERVQARILELLEDPN